MLATLKHVTGGSFTADGISGRDNGPMSSLLVEVEHIPNRAVDSVTNADIRRHATLRQSWIQRENWEFETHRPIR
jgi:hypothetical protein